VLPADAKESPEGGLFLFNGCTYTSLELRHCHALHHTITSTSVASRHRHLRRLRKKKKKKPDGHHGHRIPHPSPAPCDTNLKFCDV